MKQIDCLLVGHYALPVNKQIQLAEMAFGRDSLYYYDALEKTFIEHEGKNYTSSQLYNLFYSEGNGDLSFDHVTFEHSLNTAVATLGTHLVRSGFNIEIANTFNGDSEKLATLLQSNEVLTVGITTTFYVSAYPVAHIVRFVRRHNPNAKVVVGGPFLKNIISTYGNDTESLNRVLSSIGADFYVLGDTAEVTLARLIGTLKAGQPVDTIPNLYIRSGRGYVRTREQQERQKLERSAIEWSLFRDDLPRHVNLRTTHSCPFDCAFCGLPVTGGRWSRLPNAEIERELDELFSGGSTPGVFFIDETLNYPPNHFKEMLQFIIKKDYGFRWEAELRCNTLDRETVRMMVDSGCQLVHLGIESGSQRILDNMTKRVKLDDYYRALDLLNEFDILSNALIIVGFPGETEETFLETMDFLEAGQPTLFRVHRWFFDHETPIYERRDSYAIEGGGYHWSHASMNSVKAHELATHMSLSVKNSIHTDDYPMAFFLTNAGYGNEKTKAYLKAFDLAVKEKCKPQPRRETSDQLISQLKTVLS